MLDLFRALFFVFIVAVAGGAGSAAGLPAFVGGTLAGVFIFIFFGFRPFFEVTDYTCPHCGNKIRTIKNFGSYRCSNCGGESRIE
ncbi:MAG: transposase [Peptococcaceae bacterium]|nr:transposase [Peptococcaceae bacterium]